MADGLKAKLLAARNARAPESDFSLSVVKRQDFAYVNLDRAGGSGLVRNLVFYLRDAEALELLRALEHTYRGRTGR